MRLAHGFLFRPRDWSIIAYFNGKAVCGANVREVLTDEQVSGAFRHRTAQRLIDLGIHIEDAADFATRPYRGLPKSSMSLTALSIIDIVKQEQSES